MTYQNLRKKAIAVLRGKIIPLETHVITRDIKICKPRFEA